jgi:hypothetical protein
MTSDPLLRPTAHDLAIAPELGVLAALDAILATAAYQLAAQNPDIGADALARGYIPEPAARQAAILNGRFHSLRALLRGYAAAAVAPATHPDNIPF